MSECCSPCLIKYGRRGRVRVIITGASDLGKHLARKLVHRGDKVIVIEREQKYAKELAESLDCTIINGEGTRPDILEKAEIEKADAIVACTDHDQDNILIGLIARNNKVPKIILRIHDDQFLAVAKQLGFNDLINPSQIASSIISDTLRGVDTIELSCLVRGDVQFISVLATTRQINQRLNDVTLPQKSAFVGIYRGDTFILSGENPGVREGDEVMIITTADQVNKIRELFREVSKT
jgi:trk system potassium uptake protein TrkA